MNLFRPNKVRLTLLGMLRTLARHIILGLLGLVFVLGTAMLMAEWMVGCGETYIDAKGERHAHECLFLGKPVKEWMK